MSEVFFSQDGIRNRAFGNGANGEKGMTNFSTDNLFTGVWNLNQENLSYFDPFVQGWAGIMWTKTPQFFEAVSGKEITNQFKTLTERNFKAFSGLSDITLDVDQMSSGFTGNELPVATGIKKENTTFTLKHYELAGSPIRELYQFWVTGIRDPETGIGDYHGLVGTSDNCPYYSMKFHTGELMYVVTDPSWATGDAKGIEFACYYTNVFPTKVPMDHLNYTSGDHGLTEIDQEFRGCFHVGGKINQLAGTLIGKYKLNTRFGDYDPGTIDNVAGFKADAFSAS